MKTNGLSRRSFLGAICAAPLLGQNAGKVVNQDDHISNMDMASQSMMVPHSAPAASPIQSVSTRSGSNTRFGTYLNETRLTPAAVRGGLTKKFTLQMTGDARGIEAQPLFATGINGHDLCILTDMANQVWAFDAHTGARLWMIPLGLPVNNTRAIDAWLLNDHWGIVSTGVIDGSTLYCVPWISTDGTTATAKHYLAAINLATGVVISKLLIPPPNSVQRKQRAALTLTVVNGKKTVFVPWGTILEVGTGAHGAITAIDITAAPRVVTEWLVTPTGAGGGLWNAGQGLVADTNGELYVMTGNGDFDGVSNFGESFLHLHFNGSAISVIDHWTPWTDAARGATWDDQDLGSGGLLVLPGGLVVGCGKDGILYVLNQSNMGKTTLADLNNPTANYAKLKAAPSWFTFFPGFGVNAAPGNPAALNRMWYGATHHQHGSPLYFNGNLYCWGENSNLRAWSIGANGVTNYLGRSAEVSSPFAPTPPGGMPGAMMALSANGNAGGVIWACTPDGDANRALTTGRVFAFDVQDMAGKLPDGDNQIARIWMSDTYQYNKFNPPVVNGGMLYVPNYSGGIDVYGI